MKPSNAFACMVDRVENGGGKRYAIDCVQQR
jgi:hypothetical protein